MPDHFESRRHILQHFRDVLAQFAELPATSRAAVLLRLVGLSLPRQVIRQSAPRRFFGDLRKDRGCWQWKRAACSLFFLSRAFLQILELQFKLFNLTLDLFRLASKL